MTAQRETSRRSGARPARGARDRLLEKLAGSSRPHLERRALEHFIEAVPVGIFQWTMDGRIVDANDRFLATVGYTRDDLRAGVLRWTDLTPPELFERDQEAVEELRLTGRNTPYEKAYIRRDGTRVPILLSSVIIDDRTEQGIAFALDLTEQKQLRRSEAERDAMLVENERLYREAQEANRRKDEFITILSHELRTPLNAVLGWLTMLKQGRLDPEQRERALAIIERNVRLQAQLLSDLLDIGRLARGKVTMDVTDVDVEALIQNVVETMRPAAEEKTINLEAEVGQAPVIARGDPVRLQQVVWNLMSNAVKFTAKDGRVAVRSTASGPWVEITVSDSGAGISPEFLPFVFDLFRQEPADRARTEAGVGLGLPIVKRLVELQGGTVCAASPGMGLGATFTVRLPAARAEQNTRLHGPAVSSR